MWSCPFLVGFIQQKLHLFYMFSCDHSQNQRPNCYSLNIISLFLLSNIVLIYLLSSQNPNLDSGSSFAEGTTRLTYIASDAAMNSKRCDVYVTVEGKLISTGEAVDPMIWTTSVPSYACFMFNIVLSYVSCSVYFVPSYSFEAKAQ